MYEFKDFKIIMIILLIGNYLEKYVINLCGLNYENFFGFYCLVGIFVLLINFFFI